MKICRCYKILQVLVVFAIFILIITNILRVSHLQEESTLLAWKQPSVSDDYRVSVHDLRQTSSFNGAGSLAVRLSSEQDQNLSKATVPQADNSKIPTSIIKSYDLLEMVDETQNKSDSRDSKQSAVENYRHNFLLWNNPKKRFAGSVSSNLTSDNSKYLIYRCDAGKMQLCGGMADRIKGMIVAYIIANITDRIFKIELKSPQCDMTQYLIPNQINWTLPKPFHPSLDRIKPDTQIVDRVTNRQFYDNISRVNFTELIGTKRFVYFKANLDYSRGLQQSSLYSNQLSWMKQLTNDQILAIIFKRLFNLSPRLHSRLQNLLALELPTRKHQLICAHIRMGTNPTIPGDSVVRFRLGNLTSVWKFLRQHSTSDLHRVFLMTDSEDVMTQVKLQDFGKRLITTSGIIGHIEISRDLSTEKLCEAMEKVIFELHLLMNCDILMVSKSGLSRLGAYNRGSDTGLYCLLFDGKIIPCKMSKLKDIYEVLG